MFKKSLIDNLDFISLYKKQKSLNAHKQKDANHWDKRADELSLVVMESSYIVELANKINSDGANSLLDFGCGPGALSIILAPRFRRILAADFSLKMLEKTIENAEIRGMKNIETKRLSWEEDWDVSADIVVASRCMELMDMEAGINKLIKAAKKRVYFTYRVGKSFVDEEITKYIKSQQHPRPDYIYVQNILYQMGIRAELSFINSPSKMFCTKSFDEFLGIVSRHLTIGDEDINGLKKCHEKYRKREQGWDMVWALFGFEV